MRHPFWNIAAVLILISLGALFFLPNSPANGQGTGWSTPLNVSNSITNSSSPSLAADPAGNVHLTWVEELEDGASIIMYCQIIGGGCTTPIDILASQGISGMSQPDLISDSKGYLHIAYLASGIIYSSAYAPLAGSAANWKQPQILFPATNYMSAPSLTVGSDDALYLVFAIQIGSKSGIYFQMSEDSGKNWTEAAYLYQNLAANRMVNKPRIAVDTSGKLHVVWMEANYPETYPPIGIRYASSLDGIVWSEPISLADGPYDDPEVIAYGDDEIHVVWSGTNVDRYKFHRWSKDGGGNWLNIWRNETLGGLQGYPALVEDGDGKLHWFLVGTVFDLNPGPGITADSLYHAVFSQGKWITEEIVLLASIGEQNMKDVSAIIALGNQLHVAVANPIRAAGSTYQFDIYHINMVLDSPALQPITLWNVESETTPTIPVPRPEATAELSPPVVESQSVPLDTSPWLVIAAGVMPVFLFVVTVIIIRRLPLDR